MTVSRLARLALFGIAATAANLVFADAPGHSPRPSRPTFSFLDIPTQLNVVPAQALNIVPSIFVDGHPNPAPDGTGLVTLSTSDIQDKNGRLVGHQTATCVTLSMNASVDTEAPGEIKTCHQTLTVTGVGQLILSGTINRTTGEAGAKQALAIVGGTGAFLAARGEVVTYGSPINPSFHNFDVYLLPF